MRLVSIYTCEQVFPKTFNNSAVISIYWHNTRGSFVPSLPPYTATVTCSMSIYTASDDSCGGELGMWLLRVNLLSRWNKVVEIG